eukprot:6863513-Prorocentrum_lima.AAC.1
MTSSLVGSEMCIRDRCDLRVFVFTLAVFSGSRVRVVFAPEVFHIVTLWSVSYTHLTLPTICSV